MTQDSYLDRVFAEPQCNGDHTDCETPYCPHCGQLVLQDVGKKLLAYLTEESGIVCRDGGRRQAMMQRFALWLSQNLSRRDKINRLIVAVNTALANGGVSSGGVFCIGVEDLSALREAARKAMEP